MKWLLLIMYCFVGNILFSQSLQLHYDARHTLDQKHNTRDFFTLYFEYFKAQDSGKHFIKPGSFFLKMQSDFSGQKNNMGQFYMQILQSLRFWKPKVFLNFQYSGGLGVTEPKQYSYYITNTYSLGLSYPLKWGSAYLTSMVNYKYVSFNKGSHDFLYTLYWWKGLWSYKAELAGDFSIWTLNKNQGDDYTQNLNGKRFYFFAEPQFWYKINAIFSLGTKVNMYYRVLRIDNTFQAYPTIAVKCKL